MTCREDSKYLAKFILTYMVNTLDFSNVELLVLIPPTDTWNKELLEYFKDKIRVIPDNTGMGRGASHVFYEELAKFAKGDWLWYVCDDHYLFDGYDGYITGYIKDKNIKPDEINVIAPMCSNSGRISHILSRKYYETVGIAKHGNVDSYINDTLEHLEMLMGNWAGGKYPYVPPKPIMLDFSLDKDLMKPKNKADFNPVAQVQLFKAEITREKIRNDARKLYDSI